MATPWNGARILSGQIWAADTGLFGKSGARYSDGHYLRWLDRMPREGCLFATAPDVVADAVATMALAAPMYSQIRAMGYPVALVAQDGLELLQIPWHEFDALFLGGTTQWKLGDPAAELVAQARSLGKWVHMGRVNSLRRMKYAQAIGCDSADGTVLKHDPHRPVHTWAQHVLSHPSLWRPS